LVNYANKYGLPLPGRLPNFRNEKALLLPSEKKGRNSSGLCSSCTTAIQKNMSVRI
jgi:hypothetical protein